MDALFIVLVALVVIYSLLSLCLIILRLKSLKRVKKIKEKDILRLVSISEKLFLSEANISEVEKVFEPHIDFDYKNWCLDERVKGISEIEMKIYEIVKDTDFNNLFTSLSNNLNDLCLTESQIIDFCLKYPRHLIMEGPSNFFLTKRDFNKPAKAENLFVAHVYVYSDGLDINGYFHHFDNADILHSDYRHRVIVPKAE